MGCLVFGFKSVIGEDNGNGVLSKFKDSPVVGVDDFRDSTASSLADVQLQEDGRKIRIDWHRDAFKEPFYGLLGRQRPVREDFHTVAVGAEHRRVEIRPAVVDKGVDDRLPVGVGVEQRDFLPLDDAIALVCLRDVQHIADFNGFVQGVKQTSAAKFADRVHRGCLVLAVEHGKPDVDSAVVGKQLRQQVVFAVGH